MTKLPPSFLHFWSTFQDSDLQTCQREELQELPIGGAKKKYGTSKYVKVYVNHDAYHVLCTYNIRIYKYIYICYKHDYM